MRCGSNIEGKRTQASAPREVQEERAEPNEADLRHMRLRVAICKVFLPQAA